MNSIIPSFLSVATVTQIFLLIFDLISHQPLATLHVITVYSFLTIYYSDAVQVFARATVVSVTHLLSSLPIPVLNKSLLT